MVPRHAARTSPPCANDSDAPELATNYGAMTFASDRWYRARRQERFLQVCCLSLILGSAGAERACVFVVLRLYRG